MGGTESGWDRGGGRERGLNFLKGKMYEMSTYDRLRKSFLFI